jgi:hypothetical protein
MCSVISRLEPSHGGIHYKDDRAGPCRGGFMSSKEDERVAHCSVEEWEAGRIRVARVVVEIDAYLAGSYLTTLSATESSPVVSSGSVAVWKSWEVREKMAMSMSSLPRPLEADPVILVSSMRWWVQPEIPSAVSGLNDLKSSSSASSGGISPFLGPAFVPNGNGGPAECLARRALTTASVTVRLMHIQPAR